MEEARIIIMEHFVDLGDLPNHEVSMITRMEMYAEVTGKNVVAVSNWTRKRIRQKLQNRYACTITCFPITTASDFHPSDILYGTMWDRNNMVQKYKFI